jgi:hypothetical protein
MGRDSPVNTMKQMMLELMAEIGGLRTQQEAVMQELQRRKKSEEEHQAWYVQRDLEQNRL